MSFSEDMEALQGIVSSFERGSLPMEDALARFEEGVGLIRKCRTHIEETKRRVTKITEAARAAQKKDAEV